MSYKKDKKFAIKNAGKLVFYKIQSQRTGIIIGVQDGKNSRYITGCILLKIISGGDGIDGKWFKRHMMNSFIVFNAFKVNDDDMILSILRSELIIYKPSKVEVEQLMEKLEI